MNLRRAGVTIAIGIGLAGSGAWAAQEISSIIGPDGTINGCYSQRNGALRVVDAGTPCAKGESPIQWNQQGPPGTQGPPGPPGPKGDTGTISSLNGVPCDTGSLDKPDGRVTVTVATSGLMTLGCFSTSTNPVLTVSLAAGPELCNTVFGITFCWFSRFDAQQVDANGVAVSNGFTCASAPNLSPFPVSCQTQRFGPGATVRLGAVGTSAPAPLMPSWTGCDSVSAGVCTLSMTAARSVAVTPTN
jgi:hypothetical protein